MSWTRKLLPRSLRLRLILSFGLVIFLALFMAGVATVYLLRDREEANARERVGLLAEPVGLLAAELEAQGRPPQEIQRILSEQFPNAWILIFDPLGRVVGDSEGRLNGRTISQIVDEEFPVTEDLRYRVKHVSGPEEFLAFTWTPRGVRAVGTFTPSLTTVVAIPESDVSQAWRDLLPRLLLAGGVASLIAVIAAGLLARSISRPLRQITTASEEMARGRYDQQIPAYGGDEIGRLASAFNDMAHEVGRSHRTS